MADDNLDLPDLGDDGTQVPVEAPQRGQQMMDEEEKSAADLS